MFDFGPGKSPGLWRNRPQRRKPTTNSIHIFFCLWDSDLGTFLSQLCHPCPPPSHLLSPQAILCGEQLSFFFFYRYSSDMYCWEKLLWIVSSEWHQSNWPHQNWLLGVNKRQNMLVFYYLQSQSQWCTYFNPNKPFAWLWERKAGHNFYIQLTQRFHCILSNLVLFNLR